MYILCWWDLFGILSGFTITFPSVCLPFDQCDQWTSTPKPYIILYPPFHHHIFWAKTPYQTWKNWLIDIPMGCRFIPKHKSRQVYPLRPKSRWPSHFFDGGFPLKSSGLPLVIIQLFKFGMFHEKKNHPAIFRGSPWLWTPPYMAIRKRWVSTKNGVSTSGSMWKIHRRAYVSASLTGFFREIRVRSSGITYSASNAYLDGLSLWRRQENLPCSSLQRLGVTQKGGCWRRPCFWGKIMGIWWDDQPWIHDDQPGGCLKMKEFTVPNGNFL